jgi:mgtE-like transporter
MIYNWKRIVRNGMPLLTLSVIIEIIAGQILQGNQEFLVLLPVFLISIPVINSVGGNIGSILGARLASGLHVGYISLDFKDKTMKDNVITSLLMGGVTYFVLAIVIYYIALLSGLSMSVGLLDFVLIVLGTGLILVGLISMVSLFTAFLSFKRGLDPDDMVAPIVTTVGDTMGIVFLFVLIGVVGV